MADDLHALFNPRAVAFVGVSPDPMKYAGRALTMLRQRGFPGPIFAVNPKYREVLGAPCVKDTSELPAGEIDLAFIAVSADRVPDVIAECGRKGIGAAIVASSGFRETGPEGVARETTLVRAARAAGVRVCGPNCIGTANVLDGVVACFSNVFEREVAGGSVGSNFPERLIRDHHHRFAATASASASATSFPPATRPTLPPASIFAF